VTTEPPAPIAGLTETLEALRVYGNALAHYLTAQTNLPDFAPVRAARASLERSIAAAREADRAEIEALALLEDAAREHLLWNRADLTTGGRMSMAIEKLDAIRAALAAKEPSHG
jgi:hypothetical protein